MITALGLLLLFLFGFGFFLFLYKLILVKNKASVRQFFLLSFNTYAEFLLEHCRHEWWKVFTEHVSGYILSGPSSLCLLLLLHCYTLLILLLDYFQMEALRAGAQVHAILFLIHELVLNLQGFLVKSFQLQLLLGDELRTRIHHQVTLLFPLRMVGEVEEVSHIMQKSSA